MKKIDLTTNEQKKYEVIKKLVDEGGNKHAAVLKLNMTIRNVNKLIQRYKKEGKSAFMHGNRGRKSTTATPDDIKDKIVERYQDTYYNANIAHFTELLATHENIKLSEKTVRNILKEHYIISPKARKTTKKKLKEELKKKQELAKTQKEKDEIEENIVAIENSHSRKPRSKYFGELQQMDASSYEWIPGQVFHLHVAIDDATGYITGAWFDYQETLNGYYNVTKQILKNHGIPYSFFTDKRSVFTYERHGSNSLENDSFTQYSFACNGLGIKLDSSSIPQRKARVERLNQTLQSRLPIELRLEGIKTIEKANEFLPAFIEKFNERCEISPNSITSVFEEKPTDEQINLLLSVIDTRVVDAGHCIRFNNQYYRMLDKDGIQVHYRKGTKVLVIKAFDGKLFCSVNEKYIFALEAIPTHVAKSENFDLDYVAPSPQPQYIPEMNKSWTINSFEKFVRSQKHHANDEQIA